MHYKKIFLISLVSFILVAGSVVAIHFYFQKSPQMNQKSTFKKNISAFSYDENLNIYTDQKSGYTFLYPKYFQIHSLESHSITFIEKDTDGPWLITLEITATDQPTVHQWLQAENSKKAESEIRIHKAKNIQNTELLFLKTPVVVDRTNDKKPVYADQDSAILIKNYQLYQFFLRPQARNPKLLADFEGMVESFHFL